MSADLTALIEKLKQANEPSRELSDEVLKAIGWLVKGSPNTLWFTPDGKPWKKARPCPTSSIDAALMTAPHGWRWSIDAPMERSDGRTTACAEVFPDGEERPHFLSPFPAIAVCIAGLHARLPTEDRPHAA